MKEIEDQINAYLHYCKYVANMSPNTIRTYGYNLRLTMRQMGICRAEEISSNRVKEWIVDRRLSGNCSNTITDKLCAISTFLEFLQNIEGVPLAKVYIPRLKPSSVHRVFFTEEQVLAAISYANSHNQEMEALFILLSFETGLRLAELRNLTRQSIDGKRIVFIGKGDVQREVYVSDSTRDRLQRWMENQGIEHWLWVTKRSTHLSSHQIRRRMEKLFDAIGLDTFSPRTLRTSFATDLRMHGADILDIQLMLGHARISTTQLYVQHLPNELRDIFAKYGR